MGKKNKNIIIWLLTWAVLFLVVAYSPIGRPDLYVGTSYYISNQGVSFKGGIANAPKSQSRESDVDDDNTEMPTYIPANSYNGEHSDNASEYTPQNTTSSRIESRNSSANEEANIDNGQGVAFAYGSKKSQAQGTSTAQDKDVSSLSSDLSLTSNTSSLQAAPPNKNGSRDPGTKAKKPVIPVGNGNWILLILVGGYAIWRKQRTLKLKKLLDCATIQK